MKKLNPFYEVINEKKNCTIIDKITHKEVLKYTKGNYVDMVHDHNVMTVLENKDLMLLPFKYDIYEMIFEQLGDTGDKVNIEIQSRFLKIRLSELQIKYLNLSTSSKLNKLCNFPLNFVGKCYLFYIIVYENEKDLLKLTLEQKRGVLCLFKISKDIIHTIGPFLEVEEQKEILNSDFMDYMLNARVIHKSDRLDEYFNRPEYEIILNIVISTIFDYFSDYITNECPYFDRKIEIHPATIQIYERIFNKL